MTYERAMSLQDIERRLLLEGVRLRYGYDFRSYAEASLARRIDAAQLKLGARSALDLLARVLGDADEFERMLSTLTVTTTEAFRDPRSFRALREIALPVLRTYPRLNVWIAGCSTGEEAYSVAILLKEEGLYERSTIYATDVNREALKKARAGIYPLEQMKGFAKRYAESGGKLAPSSWYVADYGFARFDASLRENIVFTDHNLTTDGPFVEAHLVMCRNVLIYFNSELQERVLKLFTSSLAKRGFLSIGAKESIRFSTCASEFESLDFEARLFRKRRPRPVQPDRPQTEEAPA